MAEFRASENSQEVCIQNVLLHMSSWTPDPPTITIYNNNDLHVNQS